MGNKKKAKLEGLEALGARLKELRLKSGISQMKLAELLGLNPTHGYKYILRLEKGLVPNPTMRTITGYLNVCGANWQDIADVLPVIGTATAESKQEEKKTAEPVVHLPYQPEKTKTQPEDKLLLVTGLKKKEASTPDFWQLVAKAQRLSNEVLRLHHLSPTSRRLFYSFVRAVCTVVAQTPQEEAVPSQLNSLIKQAVKQGLDENLLNRLKTVCLNLWAEKETG
ncbi:MAG: helix-turn-helix transcriptional regulator [candidate division WOR-3 bacterium]